MTYDEECMVKGLNLMEDACPKSDDKLHKFVVERHYNQHVKGWHSDPPVLEPVEGEVRVRCTACDQILPANHWVFDEPGPSGPLGPSYTGF